MITQCLVSIIVPAFNRDKIISETIGSILAQSYSQWELRIVDDGSSDNTIDVIKKHQSTEPRIHLLHRDTEPKGACRCRNIGVQNANGEYIIYLDSDDLLHKHALEQRVAYMQSHPHLDFAVFPCLRFNSQPYDMNILMSDYIGKEVIPLFLKQDIPWGALNPIYKKDSLLKKDIWWNEQVGIYDDIEFHLKAVCRNLQFEMVQTAPDCFWRTHGEANPNHHLDVSRNMKSNMILLDNIVSELKASGNFSTTNKLILIRAYLIFSIKEAIQAKDLAALNSLADKLFELKIFSGLAYFSLKKILNFSSTDLRMRMLKNYCRTWTRFYGANKKQHFLSGKNEAAT